MEIRISNHPTEELQVVEVNGNPIGTIRYTWDGYEGYVGETKVMTGIQSGRKADAEMVRQIGIIHRNYIRKAYK